MSFTLFVNGAYGAGKTAVLDHLGTLLAAAQQPFSLMDVDWFHRSWPVAADDPDNTATEARNIAAVWANYRQTGPRQLVLSGVLADRQDVERYERAVGQPVRSARLVASPDTLEARLRLRYGSDRPDELRWHLERSADLQARQDGADLDELVVVTDDQPSAQVARIVLEHFLPEVLLGTVPTR
ncbi:hypothetical protein BIU90_02550 [Curtobacterium sp. MCBA15_001]|nr:hypothetical protein BIU90_02550 [Curtobacterium sp. MCBA15_001]